MNTADSGGVEQVPAYVVGDREELPDVEFVLSGDGDLPSTWLMRMR